ncbi:hypothetical protein PoB_006354200 [Plakobranchus ocellatus]|uniref:Uncharacterized protein n=1 Tax=Plakobranchus ocellatus TaxID=259542 RepID=A0AAV4CYP4_9GAST|nr:hypothetical protein PoB_006354200 [Plakobranchus ocellatus]
MTIETKAKQNNYCNNSSSSNGSTTTMSTTTSNENCNSSSNTITTITSSSTIEDTDLKVIPVPGRRNSMWCRQHKMHVGKWHVKTLLLSVVLVLIIVVYVRLQNAQIEGGSRARRQELVVHAYGAKPYKSLAYTRRTIAQIRNKTRTADKSKKAPSKKDSPSSVPDKKPDEKIKGKKPLPLTSRNVTRAPGTMKSKHDNRLEKAKGQLEDSNKIIKKEGTFYSNASKPGQDLQRNKSVNSRGASANQSRPKLASKERPSSSRFTPSVKPVKLEDELKTSKRAVSSVIQNKDPQKDPNKSEKDKKTDSSENKSKDNNSDKEKEESNKQDDDDDDDDERDEKDDRATKTKSNTSYADNEKEKHDEKDQSREREKASRPEEIKPLEFIREPEVSNSDQKTPTPSSKKTGLPDKDQSSKSIKQNNNNVKGKTKPDSRQHSEKPHDGLAEDRPKPSSKKSPSSGVKKKPTDIKLVEDSLDLDTPVDKTTSKLRLSVTPAINAKSKESPAAKTNSENGREKINNAIKKEMPPKNMNISESNDKNKSGDNEDLQKPTISEDHTDSSPALSSTKTDSIAMQALPTSADNNLNTDQIVNAKDTSNVPQIRLTDKGNSNEGFYIEGRLHFDNGLGNKVSINNQAQRNVGTDISISTVSGVNNPNSAPDGSLKENTPNNKMNDAASSIWNALYAALDSQRDNKADVAENPQPSTVPPSPPNLPTVPSTERQPIQYREAQDQYEYTDDAEYASYNDLQGNYYNAEYRNGAYNDVDEYSVDNGEYIDGSDYNVIEPANYEDAYQDVYNTKTRINRRRHPSDQLQYRLRDARKQAQRQFSDNRVHSFPNYGQRRFGSYMRVSPNDDPETHQRQDYLVDEYIDETPPNLDHGRSVLNRLPNSDLRRNKMPSSAFKETTNSFMNRDLSLSEDTSWDANTPVLRDRAEVSSGEKQEQEQKAGGPAPQSEENLSRMRQQVSARARMARYAALSAQTDPGPIEIKPLSRIQRAQKLHAIPI